MQTISAGIWTYPANFHYAPPHTFMKNKIVLKAKIDKPLHTNLFNNSVLMAILYTSKIWYTTKKKQQWLVMTWRAMERSMLEILLHEHIRSKVIGEWSRVKDMIMDYWKQKFHWAGHFTRFTDNKWTCAVAKWYLRDPLKEYPDD